MAITTMDGLVAALAAGDSKRLFFPSATNVAGGFVNLNQLAGGQYGTQATPAANTAGGTTYNQSTQAAGFPKWTADGTKSCYIGSGSLSAGNPGSVLVCDVVWACSGFSGTVTTAQTITGFTGLPARETATNGAGMQIWVGCSTAIGATAHNVTVSYTNSAGTAGRTTVSTAGIASMPAGRMYQLPLQSGDVGVSSIQSLTLSASSGTAGNLWLMILEPYAWMSAPIANVFTTYDFAALGLPMIEDEACLLFVNQGTTTASGMILGDVTVIHG